MSNNSSLRSAEVSSSEEVVCDGYYTMEGVPPSSDKHIIPRTIQIDSIDEPTHTNNDRIATDDNESFNDKQISTPVQSHQTSEDSSLNSSLHLTSSAVIRKKQPESSAIDRNNFFAQNKPPPAHTLPHPMADHTQRPMDNTLNFHTTNTQRPMDTSSTSNFHTTNTQRPIDTSSTQRPMDTSSTQRPIDTSGTQRPMHNMDNTQQPMHNTDTPVDSNNFFHQSATVTNNQLPIDTSSNNFYAQPSSQTRNNNYTLQQPLHNAPLNSEHTLSASHHSIPAPMQSPHSISPRSVSPHSVSPKYNSPSSSPKRRSPRLIQTDSNIPVPPLVPRGLTQSDSNITGPPIVPCLQTDGNITVPPIVQSDSNIPVLPAHVLIQTDSNITADESPHVSLEDTVVPSDVGDIQHNNDGSPSQNNFFLATHQGRKEIGLPTMTSFIELVINHMPDKWYDFGSSIGIPVPVLDEIERKYLGQNPRFSFIEVYKYWESHKNKLKPFLWKTVSEVLSAPLFNCPVIGYVIESIKREYLPNYDIRDSSSPDYPHSLPSRLNEQSSINPPVLPPPHLSPLDLHIPNSSARKPYTPATNVLPSPNLPYEIQQEEENNDHHSIVKSNSTGSFVSSHQSGNYYPSLPGTAGYMPLTGRGGNNESLGGLQSIPQGLLSTPQGLPAIPQGLPAIPQAMHVIPQGLQSTAQGLHSTAQGLHNAAQGFHVAPQGLQGNPQLRPPLSQIMHSSPHPQLKGVLPQVMPSDPYYQLSQSTAPSAPIAPQHLLQQPVPQMLHRDPSFYNQQTGAYPAGYKIPIDPYSLISTSSDSPVITAPNITDSVPYSTHYSSTTVSSPTTPLLTGYTVITPVSAASTDSYSSQMITLSQQATTTNNSDAVEDKSSSTFYSATEAEDTTVTNEVLIQPNSESAWLKLVQKYMQQLEQKSSLAPPPTATGSGKPARSHSPQRHRRNKNKKDETSLLQKELEKSYERISSLEVRVQDLMAQVSSDIPEDKDLSLLSKEKLEQEFKKMRELKKKADHQSVDSKQMAQRLVTENSRLKEELSQSKNECEMLVGELRNLKRKVTANERLKEVKVEAVKKSLKDTVEFNLKDLDLTPITNPLTSEVSNYPSEEFTPQLLLDAISTSENKSVLTVGQVGVVGLPSSGKSLLLKNLLKHEIGAGKLTRPKGQDTCMEFYEVMAAKNPLTGDSQWKTSSGIDTAVQYLATVTAQYYYRKKRTPSFNTPTTGQIQQSFAHLFPNITDSQMKATLNEIYRRVQGLLQEEKKRDCMTQLALFQSVFMNIWDVGVNACLYSFLPVVAGQCEHLVLLNVLDLERDVPNFDEPPIMSRKDSYRTRGDSESVMRVYGRQVYFMLMAGLKRWFNKNPPHSVAPEVLIVGTYTKELKSDVMENLVRNLKAHITVLCLDYDIQGAIDMTILTYCIDGDKKLQDKELSLIKSKLVRVLSAQPSFQKPFDPKWMLCRSLYYNPSTLTVSLEELKRVGRSCGILSHDRLDKCLLAFKNVGSLLYNPHINTALTKCHVIIDIPRMFELLDRLFYFKYYQSFVTSISLSTDTMEEYNHGLISMTLAEKVFTRQDASVCLEFLMSCKVCVEVKSSEHTMYFLPSLRRKKRLFTTYHKDSLYVQYGCHYSQCDQLVLFHKLVPKFFKVDCIKFVPCLEYNVTAFIYTNEEGTESKIEVIYYPNIIEVCVIPLKEEEKEMETSSSLKLCSKILSLCDEVYKEVCQDVQNLKYEFSLLCTNCHPDDHEAHFVNFFTNYESVVYHCQKCATDVVFDDFRMNWLASHTNIKMKK